MKSNQTPQNLMRTALLCGSLAVAGSLHATDIIKAANTNNLNDLNSWTGGVVPGTADVAVWDSTVTGPNSTLLGADLSWSGVRIANPGGLVTIGAGNTLTLGTAGIDMSAATAGLTLSNGVALPANSVQTWAVASGQTLTLAGALTRGANSALYFDHTSGGTINIASGSASNILYYSTVDGSDVGALDASRNVVAAGSVIANGYEANPLTGVPTTQFVDMINGATGTAADLALGGGSGSFYPLIVRFNQPHPYRNYWLYDTGASKNQYVSSQTTFLVTSNVGAQDVTITGSYNVFRWNSGTELILAQENTAGTLYVNGNTSQRTATTANTMTKYGAGRVVWNTALPQLGANRIVQGEFVLNGTATGPVSVHNGATFRCNGTCNGSVTVIAGGTVGVGNEGGSGTLTANNGLALNDGTKVQFYSAAIPTTNTAPLLVANGAGVTVNGTVAVDILSGKLNVGSYPLMVSTNGFAGTGSFVLGAIKPHVTAYVTNLSTTTLDLVVVSVNQPLTWTQGSGTWDLSSVNWQDSLGAATTYQEANGVGDSVLFEDSLSGASPITVAINSTLTPSTITVNASKDYTFSGPGSIGGGAVLTKAGSGTLTLGTANSYSGGVNLNGGTTVFSSIDNLGTGNISFDGGALRYNGNADDISGRTVTIGAGGATIDVGANNVTFASAVGNNGSGSLTKLGSGSLVLSGTNLYAGDTVVNAGTLTVNYGATIASPNIILNNGATLDVSAGYTLDPGVSQTLSGVGSVSGGSLTVPAGTTLSPGTPTTIGALIFTNYNSLDISGTLEMNVTTTGSDLIVGDYVNINPGSVITVPSPALTNGSYKLLQANVSLSGSLVNFTFTLGQPGKSGELVLVNEGGSTNSIYIVVSDAASDSLTWSGAGSTWDQLGTTDWYLSGSVTPWAFTNGDVVRFDEGGAANQYVSLDGALKPSLVVVSNPVTDYYFNEGSPGSKISGLSRLLKQGAGRLTISTINDNTGSTTIEGGTLEVSGSLGSGAVTNNGELVLAQSTAQSFASLSGSGGVTRNGSGTVTVAGAADYTGPTTIIAGTLQIGNGGPGGVLATSAITNDGTLDLNSSTDWTFAIPDTGSGVLVKDGTNTVTLSGVSSRTGQTRVNAGKLILGNPNQLSGSARVEAGGTLDMHGGDQFFVGLQSTTFSGGLIVNDAGTVTNLLTVSNATAYDCSAAVNDNEGTGGHIAFLKQGAGELNWRGASSYSGGSTIEEGSVRLSSASPFGTGPVYLKGGMLNFASTSSGTITNTIYLLPPLGGRTNTIGVGSTLFWGTPLVGTQDLLIDFSVGGNNDTFSSNGGDAKWAGVTNTVYLRGTGGWLRLDTGCVAPGVTFDLSDSSVTINANGTRTWQLGGLVGNSPTAWVGDSEACVVNVGYKNLNSTYAGNLSGNFSWVKVGTGTQTFTGTNTTTGSLTVSNGTVALALDAAPTNMNAFTVVGGATLDVMGLGGLNLGATIAQSLSGSGTVNGAVTATGNAVATINPGDGIGTLTVADALTLAANSVVNLQLNRTNAPATNDMIVAASIAANGTLTVTNLGPDLITGDKFKLFSAPVSGFTSVTLPASNALNTVAYVWTNKLSLDGSIELLSGASPVNTQPTNIVSSVSGGNLTLQWPADHTGWRLQMQTNALSIGLGTNWVDVAGSAATNQVTLPVNPTNPAAFFRLVYP